MDYHNFDLLEEFTKEIKEYLENRLKEKDLPEKTENYKVIKGVKDFDDVEKGAEK